MNIQKIEINKLKPAEYNPRVTLKPGDKEYEKLKISIKEFGYVEPVIWNSRTGNVIGGHQRLTVMKDLGFTEIDCVIVDLDEIKEKALNIALNKIQGSWDDEKLASLITDLDSQNFDVTMTGFDAAEIDELMNQFYSKDAIEDDFDYEEKQNEIKIKGAVTKNGDVWKLGNHRLICGSNTDEHTYKTLLNGKTAQLCVTAPQFPTQKEYEEKGINAWLDSIRAVVGNVARYSGVICWGLGDFYLQKSQFIEPINVLSVNVFADLALRPIWIRIWKKQQSKGNPKSYRLVTNKPIPQYEYISAFGKETEEYNDQEYEWLGAFASHSYKFVKRLSKEERKKWGYAGIWEMTPVKTITENQNSWPVQLPWRVIKMHSDKGGIVLEPYGNTGTTLIACEQTDRSCYLIENNCEMCDLIIERWQNFTNLKAEKNE